MNQPRAAGPAASAGPGVLTRAPRPVYLSAAVAADPQLARLCAVMWHAAGGLPSASEPAVATPRDLLTNGIFRALADSIEADGHRVCSLGIEQRLLAAGRGYIAEIGPELPPPGQLLTALAEAFRDSLGAAEPTGATLAQFRRDCLKRAARVYCDDPGLSRTFARHLDANLDITYADTD